MLPYEHKQNVKYITIFFKFFVLTNKILLNHPIYGFIYLFLHVNLMRKSLKIFEVTP